MNHRLLVQVATPAVLLGVGLLGACLTTAWYINRLESNLVKIVSENVTSLQAAQELEIRVRQLRTHCFLYFIEPTPARLAPIELDNRNFEEAMKQAQHAANSPEKIALATAIQAGYQQYLGELADLRADVVRNGPRTDFGNLADTHPIRHVTDVCHQLLRLNKEEMDRTTQESQRVSKQANLIVLLLGFGAPFSGLLLGFGIARNLNRSLYRLSVRVQDMAKHLDQNVATVNLVVDGDIENLDKQLQHVMGRVEETAKRLQQQERDMLRAEQLAAVGQLAASVAHEVRNPLTSIKMLVEAAQRQQNRKPLDAEDLTVIHGEIARLEQAVQGFLNFARLPTPKRSLCDLRKVVGHAMDLVRARAQQQGVQTAFTVRDAQGELAADQAVPGYADEGQICTVLVNLFLNALDAMPRGGRLDTELDLEASGTVRLRVSDTGSGIANDMLDRLFTPFLSTKPTGTGLGLSISQRIIEEHGGNIRADNRPEQGARFTITLPPGPKMAEEKRMSVLIAAGNSPTSFADR